MQLYLLEPQPDLPDNDNPWEPWYDKCFGMVVRASCEAEARTLAQAEACDEAGPVWDQGRVSNSKAPWLSQKYSSCVVLEQDGLAAVIIQDCRAA